MDSKVVPYLGKYRFLLVDLYHIHYFYGEMNLISVEQIHRHFMHSGDDMSNDGTYQLLLF
jgi:hypothetical protein